MRTPTFKPGQKTPASGKYRPMHLDTMLETNTLVHCQQGRRFPPTPDPGMGFVLTKPQ
jgi:hypothetical protein